MNRPIPRAYPQLSRRSVLTATFAGSGAILLGSVSACGSGSGAEKGPSTGAFEFQCGWYPNAEYMGQTVALAKGYYKDEGLRVEIVPGGPNAVVDSLVSTGKRNAASTATDKVASSYINGLRDLRIIAAGYQVTSSCIVSLAKTPIRKPHDLIGKKFGVAQTDIPVYDAFFRLVGVEKSKITYVPSSNDPSVLLSGDVDAISSTLPGEPVTLRLKGHDVVTLALGDYDYNRWSGAIFVSQKLLDNTDSRDQIKGFLRGTIRGYQAAHDDPEMAAKIVVDKYAQKYGYDLKTITESAREWAKLLITPTTRKHGIFRMTKAGIAGQQHFLNQVGIDVKSSELFRPDLMDEIYGTKNHL